MSIRHYFDDCRGCAGLMGWIHGPEPRVFVQGAAMSGPLCRRAMPGETRRAMSFEPPNRRSWRCAIGAWGDRTAWLGLSLSCGVRGNRLQYGLREWRHAFALIAMLERPAIYLMFGFCQNRSHPPASQVRSRRRYRSPARNGLGISTPEHFFRVAPNLVAF